MPEKSRIRWVLVAAIAIALLAFLAWVLNPWGAPGGAEETERFVVPEDVPRYEAIERLADGGYIKYSWAFSLAHPGAIPAGAYRLAPAMSAFEVSRVIEAGPYMKWVTIPEGLRKEEIAARLAETLAWSEEEVEAFINAQPAAGTPRDGIYFPDTYLIPLAETPAEVAARMYARFNEEFEPYLEAGLRENIKWTTLLNVAALIQREAAGGEDMPIISGVIWNRLLRGMRLDIDATIQYALGETSEGEWWEPIKSADKQIDSPYNTYRFRGLPPAPIANPGIPAIEAALSPAESDCLFYLHGNDGAIHCSPTYEGHQENIDRYLR